MNLLARPTRTLAIGLVTILASTLEANAVSVGDIALIGFASDNPDALAFVVLREIPAGTALRFTDSGWQSSGSFRANEGGIQYTAATTLTPGDVISMSDPFASGGWSVNNAGLGTSFALSTSGDQIIAFVGNASSPDFIHAVHFDSTNYVEASSSNTTALPTGLVVGESAVNLGETDNGFYSGPTTGTPAELLAAIGDPGNWSTSDSSYSPPSWSFNVIGSGPVLQDVLLDDTEYTVGESALVTVVLSAAPAVGSPVTVELTSGAFNSAQQVVISNPDDAGTAIVDMDNEGVWTIAASAIDNATGTAVSANFTVGSPLIPPTAEAGPSQSVELNGAVVIITLDGATGDDAEGLAGASYEWTPASTAGLVNWQNRSGPLNATTAPASAQVSFDTAGAYVLTLTITDSDGLTATDTTTITVNSPVSTDEFDAPEGYYAAATGQGSTLKTQLSQIITAGHVQQQYGDFRYTAARYDADPEVPGNILLVYNRASVSGNWDSGATWSREHVWPQSLQPGEASNSTTGNLGDPHALRPVNPSINSSRGNKPFGTFSAIGVYGPDGSFYFPGDADKGDIARSQFYSATRYMSTLSLVNGIPSGNTMGDLASLVRWHYTDVPDFFERRRNHLVWEDQHNRIPYVDHPEFVWSVFGDGANDSTLYVSAVEPADGASTTTVAFGPIIVGGPLPTANAVTLRKAGNDPTYYSVTPSGHAGSDVVGRFNAFDFGTQQRTLMVSISALADTPGLLSGQVVIDNLDISSEGAGQGSDDGDDVIDVSLTVYDHSEGSLSATVNTDSLTIDFGTVPPAAGPQSASYGIYNIESASGLTAALEVLAVLATGDEDVLQTDAGTFTDLPGGASAIFGIDFDPTAHSAGSYAVTYTLEVADEDLPGSAIGVPLTLTVTGTVSPAEFPFNDDGDIDIDALDAANFVDCLTGPSGGIANLACTNHDADEDGDVDLWDAAALQVMFTGGE